MSLAPVVVPVDVLAFGPHPDDVELGCGGTLASLAGSGRGVGIVDLTRGEMATRGTPETRAQEAAEAARLLGARFRANLDLGDGDLRTDRAAQLAVVETVRRAKPAARPRALDSRTATRTTSAAAASSRKRPGTPVSSASKRVCRRIAPTRSSSTPPTRCSSRRSSWT